MLAAMTGDQVRLRAETLKGIAHPLRVRLLDLLREDGPSTATRLAERTGQSSGATSYHLRQLAAYGFVVEEARGSGRERWWRAAHRGTTLNSDDARESPAEAEAYLRVVAAEYADRVDRWLSEVPTMPREWDDGMALNSYRLRLTATEAARLVAQFEEVVAAYPRADPEVEAPPDTERVVVHFEVMPFVRRGQ
jgi:DNA-binding transcriptional ArsR family regulator